MRLPSPEDPELKALADRYVSWSFEGPCRNRYMKIMGVNALRPEEPRRSMLMQSLAYDARKITDQDLGILLTSEWRARLTAAWLIGLDRRIQFREHLGHLLHQGTMMKAGAGYSFALARFGEQADAEILTEALEHNLPKETFYERHLVIGALLHLDNQLATDRARHLLAPDAPWPVPSLQDQERYKGYIEQLCAFADKCMFRESPTDTRG
jgi:hypothetical protein